MPTSFYSNFPKVFFAALLLLTLAACGQSSSSGTPAPPPPPPGGGSGGGTTVPRTLAGPRPDFGPRNYVLFESAPVRPVLITNDKSSLVVANIPDNRIEIFDINPGGLTHRHSVPVGLEPVALAQTGDGLIWVVNHISDSISLVDIARPIPEVVRTLYVGDEPRDIVVAGNAKERVFITTAHRGQNSLVDPALTTPAIGRADIWVFDSTNLGSALGGAPETVLTVFGDTPRPLAVSNDQSTVYVGIFRSGNQTTVIGPSGLNKPAPNADINGVPAPDSGSILRFNGQNWVDDGGQNRSSIVPFSLPDFDVFRIDADASLPVETGRWSGVGTTLMNMAVNPQSGDIFVTNLEARNHIRFSGDGSRSTTVNGHLTENRVTVISSAGVLTRNLNKHLDRSQTGGTASDRNRSLSMPMELAFTADGLTAYVTAFGSSKIGVFSSLALTDDSFTPSAADHISVTGGGPAGIVLDETNNRAYVYTRFDNGISVVDLISNSEIDHINLPNPEPAHIVDGRPFQYDARLTSGNGNDSCGSCHLFGDNDALSWDLGVPEGSVKNNPNAFTTISNPAAPNTFHSMKGPMTTQSMRGLTGHGPMHWRGDRTGQNRVGGETLEEAAFKEFNEAFVALMGRNAEISAAEMQMLTDFAMELTYPPNPIRALDNSLNAVESRGLDHFNQGLIRVQTGQREVCRTCHTLNPAAGIFGTSGLMSDNSQPGERNFKIPHFRDQYQKVGMFGFGFQTPAETGPQVRGFGYNHNGATSGNFAIADLGLSDTVLAEIRAFLFAFPTEQAPIVGQQATVNAANINTVRSRIDLLVERGLATDPVPECDLIVKGVVDGRQAGFLMNENQRFQPDSTAASDASLGDLLGMLGTRASSLTFTCVPWGSGQRMGLDRDMDAVLDGDEIP